MYVIGLDIGTTNTKAVVFDTEGNVIAQHQQQYTLTIPRPDYAEQNPRMLLNAAVHAIQQVVRESKQSNFIGVGISAAMHSLLLIDEQHRPLTEVITWADNRSAEQATLIRQQFGLHLYERTGTPIHPMAPVSKLLWYKQNQPALFKRTAKFVSFKDYMLFQWFGRYVTDYSIASASGLFNLKSLDWDAKILDWLGIRKEQLPIAVPTTYPLRGLNPHWARQLGLHPDTPFIIGASDGCLANLGIGAIEPDELAITIGTSGAIRAVVGQPLIDPKMRSFCYALTDKHWVIGGPTNNGGLVLQWFRDQLATGVSLEQLTREAASVPPGSDGLLCLPYLTGERAPIWNADARGTFFGVMLHHQRAHFTRAIMEGVIFCLYRIGQALQELTGDFHTLRASGGFAQSPLWCQILADVFGIEVNVPESHQSSSWGAAILVLLAMGKIERIDAFRDRLGEKQRYLPNQNRHQTYQQLHPLFEELSAALTGPFGKIAAMQREQK
ncbi:gluconate kinase [Ammoniphilus oxalaticus]|uniref:Gluconate kinase n=1 Tax=Ammoniphilus oxalaticus TaxID=66863 RepID=A0A419SGL8_9BACL|nr:gluconokinase [Ammoniphilus oxalaticus]RKD22942.1 gluconate kinase [Ammoniphilus oxalaticus]